MESADLILCLAFDRMVAGPGSRAAWIRHWSRGGRCPGRGVELCAAFATVQTAYCEMLAGVWKFSEKSLKRNKFAGV